MRLFIQNYSLKIPSIAFAFIGWNRKTEEEKKAIIDKQGDFLESLNNELRLPYALGDTLNIADILLYPFFEIWGGL